MNTCRFTRQFAGPDASQDELDVLLDLVDSQKFGKLKRYDVQQLNKLLYLRNHSNISPEGHPAPTIWTPWLYYLQQTINGVTLGCLYALLAVAFTLIYGITRFINLAFGDLYMVGAFTTYIGYILTVVSGASFTFLPIIVIGCFVVASAAAAWSSEKPAARRSRAQRSNLHTNGSA